MYILIIILLGLGGTFYALITSASNDSYKIKMYTPTCFLYLLAMLLELWVLETHYESVIVKIRQSYSKPATYSSEEVSPFLKQDPTLVQDTDAK